jgi:hypothetical protein
MYENETLPDDGISLFHEQNLEKLTHNGNVYGLKTFLF